MQDFRFDPITGRMERKHQNIIRRYFQILNMYPKIEDAELARKIEDFTMNATLDQLFRMQRMVILEGSGFMIKDPRWKGILEYMDGKSLGFAIGEEYKTTLTLRDVEFRLEKGIAHQGIPVLSVASRKDYVDALLRRKDIIRMVVSGKLRATHKLTLARWGLAFAEYLHDDSLFEELLSHQKSAERSIIEAMEEMGFQATGRDPG